MDVRDRIRPILAGESIQAANMSVEIKVEQQALAMRNFYRIVDLPRLGIGDAANAQGWTIFRLKIAFHGSEFDGLGLSKEAGIEITGKDLQRRRDESNEQCEEQAFLIILPAIPAQEGKSIDPRHDQRRDDKAGQEHMNSFIGHAGIEDRLPGIHIRNLPIA